MAKDKTTNKTMQLQTKVSPEVYARLESICQTYGFSIFQLLRMLSECIIRYMDDQHNLSDDLIRVMRMFEDIPGWRKSICLAEGLEDMNIVEAFYVLRAKHLNGYRLVHVERPVMQGDEDGWIATFNVQRMTERFVELLNPSLYKHLRMLAVDLGTQSMLDTIHTIANLYKENPDEVELRLQFESNDWHMGAHMQRDTVYQRRNSHSMEYIDQQSLFDNNNQ